jgi:hypothetical protein
VEVSKPDLAALDEGCRRIVHGGMLAATGN